MRIVRDVQLLLKHEDTLKAVAPILFAKKGDAFDVALPYDWEQYRWWEDSRVLAHKQTLARDPRSGDRSRGRL